MELLFYFTMAFTSGNFSESRAYATYKECMQVSKNTEHAPFYIIAGVGVSMCYAK
jgi:hypothetical protein